MKFIIFLKVTFIAYCNRLQDCTRVAFMVPTLLSRCTYRNTIIPVRLCNLVPMMQFLALLQAEITRIKPTVAEETTDCLFMGSL